MLERDQTQLEQPIDTDLTEQRSSFLSQKDGLGILYRFITGTEAADAQEANNYLRSIAFSDNTAYPQPIFDATPFLLEARINPRFYLGIRGNGGNYYLSIPSESETLEPMVVYPDTLSVGNKPYYWLDFYSHDQTKEDGRGGLLNSCRLKPDDPINKIDFQHWRGIGEQLLSDYLMGENGIGFENLRSFDVSVNANTGLQYRLGGKTQLSLNLGENPKIQKGDRLKISVKRDEQQLYEWIDISKSAKDGSEDIVASYRTFSESQSISRYWPGVERQLLIDYLSGDTRISFESLKPIVVIKAKNDAINLGSIDGKQTAFYLPFGIKEQQTIGLFPNQDKDRRYQWLDLYKVDAGTRTPVGEVISSGRIQDGAVNQKDWQGPERQLLRDFTKGEVSFSALQTIKFSVGKRGDYLNLWRDGNKKVYLVLSKNFNLKEGDALTFIPESESEQIATFLLSSGDDSLGRYRFDKDTGLFYLTDNLIVNKGVQLEYFSDDGKFIDDNGNEWAIKTKIAKRHGVSTVNLTRLLEGISTMQYKQAGTDRRLTLFNEAEIHKRAQELNITPLDHWSTIQYDLGADKIPLLVFRDNEGSWLSSNQTKKFVKGINLTNLQGVRSKIVRSVDGKKMSVYSLEDLIASEEISSIIHLPRIDKETRVYSDSDGRWTTITDICAKHHIHALTLQGRDFFNSVRRKPGITSSRISLLYNLDDLEANPEFQSFVTTTTERRLNKNSREYWTQVRIEQDAQALYESGVPLTMKDILAAGRNDLAKAVAVFYPGNYRGLRKNLGLIQERPQVLKRKNFKWTLETIEEKATEIYQTYGDFSQPILKSLNLYGLISSIPDKYPGGMTGLKHKLGIKIGKLENGYWQNPDNILTRARAILTKGFDISQLSLREQGETSFSHAVSKYYPGGMRGLRRALGLEIVRRENGSWTQETIEAEAMKIYQQNGDFSRRLLDKLNRSDLANAIRRNYPGRYSALKDKLGISDKDIPSEEANQYLRNLVKGGGNDTRNSI